ncbi:uncharacterized protein LOC115891722 [Sitophilus oryzae]|uniref:Uncharacterized protein LOC115891722 n=1 Tax=Sitophilus oryzae TaxID=7048 RepID=A0A6J2YZ69_SITOR|nr:uncharacterized protein LOC115891722 [Sitophilus oryzae]
MSFRYRRKLYEHLILIRLNEELDRIGTLSARQYGFRKGRQTIHAIEHVLLIARQAADYAPNNRKLCAVITLDVQNAFNSASWQIILDEMQKWGISSSLTNMVASYLSERTILIEDDTAKRHINVTSGVPQVSALGVSAWPNTMEYPVQRPTGNGNARRSNTNRLCR